MMLRNWRKGSALILAFCLSSSVVGVAFAAPGAGHDEHAGHGAHGDHHAAHGEHGAEHDGHGEHHAAHGEHGAEHGGHGEHGGHHVPQWSDINWAEGVLGEKEGVTPNLLWRAPGTPVPLLTLFINTAVLFFILGRIASPALKNGLRARKERIAGDIEFASKMKASAEEELEKYESKLEQMASEMERIKKEMREQAEHDRVRILKDAEERALTLAADARLRVEQDLSEAKKAAARIAVRQAIEIAREEIKKNMNQQDQEKLAADLLVGVQAHFKKGASA